MGHLTVPVAVTSIMKPLVTIVQPEIATYPMPNFAVCPPAFSLDLTHRDPS